MSGPTTLRRGEVASALDDARYLAERGVPIFVARRVLGADGSWDPSGGVGGYQLPRGWHLTEPNPAVVDTWREGMALCAVMGHAVDALDVDPRNGGAESLAALRADDVMPRAYGVAATPSGGEHYLIAPLRVGSKDGLLPGLDLKGGGRAGPGEGGHGFVFLAPTVKVSKATGEAAPYRWTNVPDLDTLNAAEDASGAKLAELVRASRSPAHGSVDPEDVPEASDDQRAYAVGEVGSLAGQAAALPEGERNHGLLLRARLAGGFVAAAQLDADDAIDCLADAGVSAGLDRDEAARTARNGVELGLRRPVALPEADVAARVTSEAHRHHHERFATRLADAYADRIMWVESIGWHSWDGVRWRRDAEARLPMRCVADVLREATSDAAAANDAGLAREARGAQTAHGMRGVLAVAQTMDALWVPTSAVDADPWLLNTPGATVDLRTGEAHTNDPADRLTKVTRAAWRPDERAAVWDDFLASSLPDTEVRGFLQRYAGLALVGQVIEHRLLINIGEGRNGKGVFSGALAKALGDYAATADPELFLLDPRHPGRSAGTEAKLFSLRGVRSAFMSEIPRGARLNEALMKTLTGGDPIQAKPLYGQPVEFDPSHSYFIAANDLPSVDADAAAVWARLLAVPWDVSFLGREDPDLPDKLTAAAEAVLAWAYAGLREWERRGRRLDPPAAVTARTEGYRHDNDVIGDFLDEACDVSPDAWERVTALKAAYTAWSRTTGRRGSPPASELAHRLESRGFKASKRRGQRGLVGVRTLDASPFDSEDLL